MNHADLIKDLKQDAERRAEALAVLTRIHGELGELIAKLGGGSRKSKARGAERGVTTGEVERLVSELRSQAPNLTEQQIGDGVRQKLKDQGRTLTGISLRLAQVLGRAKGSGDDA